MGKIITIASHKGGVGKTTTTLNLGFCISRLGQKVLLVDADPQGGMAVASNLKRRTRKGLVNVLKNEVQIDRVVIPTKDRRLGVLGSGVSEPEEAFEFEREIKKGGIAKILEPLSAAYDYVFIDAPAGIGGITTALLSISQSVIVPISCNAIAVKTLPMFLKLIQKIREKKNAGLQLEGIVVTMADDSAPALEVMEQIQQRFPAPVLFEAVIPYDESFEFASIKSIPVALLSGGETASKSYMDLAVELKMRELTSHSGRKNNEEDEGLF